MTDADVLVIGGGMAGVSIACELATDRRVVLLEAEPVLAYHTTGRSAAVYLETYGGAAVRALTTGSRAFFADPPDTLDRSPFTPLPNLFFGRREQAEQMFVEVSRLAPGVELLGEDDVRRVFPPLRPGAAQAGVFEPDAQEVDVAAVHQGYARGFARRGGTVVSRARVASARRAAAGWELTTTDGTTHRAPQVVDAAGAWADEVARLFGARPVGLRPLRRTAFTVPAADATTGLPLAGDLDETFYVKPEGAQFLCSPADETPVEPHDAKPDELEIARAIDAINEATTLGVRSVRTSWAGLRTFAPDRTPVAGPDPEVEGLFWFAGQGGYGIQTAPALARAGAAVLRGAPFPADLTALGLDAAHLAPGRLVTR